MIVGDFMLKIQNLSLKADNKELLNNINLEINEGEIHVLMGPNGAGKSTLCKAILSHPSLEKTSGQIYFFDKNITALKTDEIARLGIYYISQSPVEIEGVKNIELIRSALRNLNKHIDIFEFNKKNKIFCEQLNIDKDFIHREINVNMSGGEKKKNELLTMLFLQPKLIILDEIDSGLDIDSIKSVAKILKNYQEKNNCAILIVSHQEMLIKLLNPTFCHLIKNKTIIKSGDTSLIKTILEKGFANF